MSELLEDDEAKAREFAAEYQKLCEKFKMRIRVDPVFLPTNHGSYELALRTSVERLQ